MTKKELEEHFQYIRDNCFEKGWGGYDDDPVTEEAIDKVKEFIILIPHVDLVPEPIPLADGSVELEWCASTKTETKNLILGIDEDRKATFAGTADGVSYRGSFDFKGEIPDFFRLLIIMINMKTHRD